MKTALNIQRILFSKIFGSVRFEFWFQKKFDILDEY
jgi:hypothetical protein